MYRIIRVDGSDICYVDEVTYIKIGRSGSFVPAAVGDAIGIALNGIPYNLVGHDEIDGETVTVAYVDVAVFVQQTAQNTANLDYLSAMTGICLPNDEENEQFVGDPTEDLGDEVVG